MEGRTITHCSQYPYLGAPVRVIPTIATRQRIHLIIKDLLDRLQQRFTPVKWLAISAAGVSIPVAKTIYVMYMKCVVDYLFTNSLSQH